MAKLNMPSMRPSVEDPLGLVELGQVVSPVPLDALAHVEVGAGALAVRIEAVVGLAALGTKSRPSLAVSMECAQV